MAERLNNRHQEMVKQKIQSSQLVNRLQKHAFGEIEMSSTQIDSAKFLLNKRLSNAPVITEADINLNMTIEQMLSELDDNKSAEESSKTEG